MTASQSSSSGPNMGSSIIPAFLRDVRVLQIIGQLIFLIVLIALASSLVTSIFSSLASKNLTPNFAFLSNRAGFDISERPEWYTSNSNYGQAFQVGVINTLRVVSVGLVLSTILGVLVGIFLLSNNFLIRNISKGVVELLRNTPLLVQLFFWYFIVMLSLPSLQQAATFPNEGVALIPIRLLIYLIVYFIGWRSVQRYAVHSPRRVMTISGLIAAFIAVEVGFWLWGSVYASGNPGNVGFLFYAGVSIALIAAIWFLAPPALKWRALGLATGQFIGGLAFYFGIVPASGIRTELYPALYISVRGFVFPEILPTSRFADWLVFVVIGILVATAIWIYFGRINETTGSTIRRGLYAAIAIIAFPVLGWFVVGLEPAPATVPVINEEGAISYVTLGEAQASGVLTKSDQQLYSTQPLLVLMPQVRRNRVGIINGFDNGSSVTPEYMALLLGLVVYTAAFIAEIVRAGILAVPRGQIEASRALGLSTSQTLRMVILPQSLRVIIPPLGNQYLNLSKNSSLAVALAYADVLLITQTIMNQSGQSVTGITMIMLVYLTISLAIASVTNYFNKRFQLVTR